MRRSAHRVVVRRVQIARNAPGRIGQKCVDNVRLHRLREGVKHVLDLAGLLPDGIKRTALLGRLVDAATVAWGSHAVAARVASHCRHVDGFRISHPR